MSGSSSRSTSACPSTLCARVFSILPLASERAYASVVQTWTRTLCLCKLKLQDVVLYAPRIASCPYTHSVLETKIENLNK